MTQVIGLSDRAINFLIDNVLSELKNCPCPHCKEPHLQVSRKEVYDKETGVNAGMFEDGPYLHVYDLIDGKKAYEYVQHVEWSSGPCIFLSLRTPALEKKNGWKSISGADWTEEEIRRNV